MTGNIPSLKDPSLAIILFSNIISIILAVIQDWNMDQILWIYWGQSVVIGVINVIRMLSLKEFTTKGMKMSGKSVPETHGAKIQIAAFFTFHYGFFHLVYFIFLWQELPLTELSQADFMWLILLVFSFIGSHGFSYRHNLQSDFKQQRPNLGTLMFYPYMRIIPMHLIIIFGTLMTSTLSLVIFMLMKTVADCGMHMTEHHMFRKEKN